MMTEICAAIKNFFVGDEDKVQGTYSVIEGAISPDPGILKNQYFAIFGSVFNDGVHQEGDVLVDEPKFEGAIWKMRVPAPFIDLVSEIEDWQEKNGKADSEAMSPFVSESFGGYSYSKGGKAENGGITSWKEAFRTRLDPWRKIRL